MHTASHTPAAKGCPVQPSASTADGSDGGDAGARYDAAGMAGGLEGRGWGLTEMLQCLSQVVSVPGGVADGAAVRAAAVSSACDGAASTRDMGASSSMRTQSCSISDLADVVSSLEGEGISGDNGRCGGVGEGW